MSLDIYYKLLGIQKGASLTELKSAYRKMAFRYHPDRNLGDAKAEDKFKEILAAYEELSKVLEQEPAPSSSRPRRKPVRKKASRYSNPKASKADTNSNSPRKKNLRYNVFISLEESITGCSKIIRYIRHKDGAKENVQLKVTVPPGARHKQRLKVSDFGEVTSTQKGDLYIIVHHQPHHLFEVEGLNLITRVPVTYLEALLGQKIEVPTLEGIAHLDLAPCQFSSLYHEIPNKGLRDGESSARGSLFVECYLDQPDTLTPEEKKAVESLNSSWPMSEKMTKYRDELLRGDSL